MLTLRLWLIDPTLVAQKTFNLLFSECLKALQDENSFRVAHALEVRTMLKAPCLYLTFGQCRLRVQAVTSVN
jgi:hypothetical protein